MLEQNLMSRAENDEIAAILEVATVTQSQNRANVLTNGTPKEIADFHEKAASNGDVSSMLALANIYINVDENDVGREHDIEKAVYWAEMAAKTGDETAILVAMHIRISYATLCEIVTDFQGAVDSALMANNWLEKALSKGYDVNESKKKMMTISGILGKSYYYLGRYVESARYSFQTDDPMASMRLSIFMNDTDVPPKVTFSDTEKSIIINRLEKTLSNESVDIELKKSGYVILGWFYQLGMGTQQNTIVAYNCFVKARELGNKDATKTLAKHYKKTMFGVIKFK